MNSQRREKICGQPEMVKFLLRATKKLYHHFYLKFMKSQLVMVFAPKRPIKRRAYDSSKKTFIDLGQKFLCQIARQIKWS